MGLLLSRLLLCDLLDSIGQLSYDGIVMMLLSSIKAVTTKASLFIIAATSQRTGQPTDTNPLQQRNINDGSNSKAILMQ